jgi:hypothetical protein
MGYGIVGLRQVTVDKVRLGTLLVYWELVKAQEELGGWQQA